MLKFPSKRLTQVGLNIRRMRLYLQVADEDGLVYEKTIQMSASYLWLWCSTIYWANLYLWRSLRRSFAAAMRLIGQIVIYASGCHVKDHHALSWSWRLSQHGESQAGKISSVTVVICTFNHIVTSLWYKRQSYKLQSKNTGRTRWLITRDLTRPSSTNGNAPNAILVGAWHANIVIRWSFWIKTNFRSRTDDQRYRLLLGEPTRVLLRDALQASLVPSDVMRYYEI